MLDEWSGEKVCSHIETKFELFGKNKRIKIGKLASVENIQTSTQGIEACAVNFKTLGKHLEEKAKDLSTVGEPGSKSHHNWPIVR